MTRLEDRLTEVRARIDGAARRCHRDPAEVLLVGATKTVPATQIAEAVALGLTDLGENRAQELVAKAPSLPARPAVRWHFLGRLQRNKVRGLAAWVTWWQSVDRDALGEAIARHVPGAQVLVEVNLAGEPQKGGCAPGDAERLVDALRGRGLRVEGVMTVPPQDGEPRRWFAALRELATRLELPQLSMGMTDDYEVAIEEGATMVRIGRAIFGTRAAANPAEGTRNGNL